jgi:hypothetical protein
MGANLETTEQLEAETASLWRALADPTRKPTHPGPAAEAGAAPAPKGPANFPTGWCKTRQAAYQWLAS